MTILQQVADDAGTIGNSSASAAVVGVSLMGMSLPDIVALISGVYFLLSTVFLVMKFIAWRKDRAKATTVSSRRDGGTSDSECSRS
ncbi:hypothetical protein [Pseudomonas phage Nerthus]|uniref:Holin n=1 Tax=Pseudomonas phage Nerthus TaxID=2163984 RepID=A0A2S1GMR9_9CAUD|nr:hypothetical protein HOT09_gp43 [Pseudomonas phage Nerthus]AWD90675.1 hypothetical protein [Pseudomonas phage Nerthus]